MSYLKTLNILTTFVFIVLRADAIISLVLPLFLWIVFPLKFFLLIINHFS